MRRTDWTGGESFDCMSRTQALLATAAVLLTGCTPLATPPPEALDATVVTVIDGDTLRVTITGGGALCEGRLTAGYLLVMSDQSEGGWAPECPRGHGVEAMTIEHEPAQTRTIATGWGGERITRTDPARSFAWCEVCGVVIHPPVN